MSGLADVLRGLAARDGVQGALLLSGEGLPIDHAGSGFESDAVAALAATLAHYAGQLGADAGRGELRTAVLDFARGPLVLTRGQLGLDRHPGARRPGHRTPAVRSPPARSRPRGTPVSR
jgi:predicted regulator of Ras-like GTPase activity (Roadblock/LC7/MglB family)